MAAEGAYCTSAWEVDDEDKGGGGGAHAGSGGAFAASTSSLPRADLWSLLAPRRDLEADDAEGDAAGAPSETEPLAGEADEAEQEVASVPAAEPLDLEGPPCEAVELVDDFAAGSRHEAEAQAEEPEDQQWALEVDEAEEPQDGAGPSQEEWWDRPWRRQRRPRGGQREAERQQWRQQASARGAAWTAWEEAEKAAAAPPAEAPAGPAILAASAKAAPSPAPPCNPAGAPRSAHPLGFAGLSRRPARVPAAGGSGCPTAGPAGASATAAGSRRAKEHVADQAGGHEEPGGEDEAQPRPQRDDGWDSKGQRNWTIEVRKATKDRPVARFELDANGALVVSELPTGCLLEKWNASEKVGLVVPPAQIGDRVLSINGATRPGHMKDKIDFAVGDLRLKMQRNGDSESVPPTLAGGGEPAPKARPAFRGPPSLSVHPVLAARAADAAAAAGAAPAAAAAPAPTAPAAQPQPPRAVVKKVEVKAVPKPRPQPAKPAAVAANKQAAPAQGLPASSRWVRGAPVAFDGAGREMCGDFQRGDCQRGARCRFSHGGASSAWGGAAAPADEAAEPAEAAWTPRAARLFNIPPSQPSQGAPAEAPASGAPAPLSQAPLRGHSLPPPPADAAAPPAAAGARAVPPPAGDPPAQPSAPLGGAAGDAGRARCLNPVPKPAVAKQLQQLQQQLQLKEQHLLLRQAAECLRNAGGGHSAASAGQAAAGGGSCPGGPLAPSLAVPKSAAIRRLESAAAEAAAAEAAAAESAATEVPPPRPRSRKRRKRQRSAGQSTSSARGRRPRRNESRRSPAPAQPRRPLARWRSSSRDEPPAVRARLLRTKPSRSASSSANAQKTSGRRSAVSRALAGGSAHLGAGGAPREVDALAEAPTVSAAAGPAAQEEPARRARSPGEGGRPSGEGEGKMWDWLLSLDKGKGGLLQYFPRIQMEFDCEFAQIAASRLPQPVSDGVLGMVQPQLFEALHMTRTGHKLLLAKGIMGLP